MRRTGLLAFLAVAGCIPSDEAPSVGSPPLKQERIEGRRDRDAQSAEPSRADDARETERREREATAAANREILPAAPPQAARPAWEVRPVTADAVEVGADTYSVQPGDTLTRIAERTGAGVDAIARANALEQPYTLRTGQQLAIPAGRYHLVRPGQSGIAIARAYAVPWSRIVTANGLAEPYVLRAGQRVLIPGAPTSANSRAAERAAAFTLDVDSILTGGEPALARNAAPAAPAATPARVPPATVTVAPPTRLAGGGFAWPVDGRVIRRFGPGASGERNDGIKIAVPLSTPIRATADGVVAYAGDGIAALGGLVMVKHGGGWTSIYGHASKLLVQRGQSVKRGQTVALSGETGFADRPEVHFELRRGRTPVDPQGQLPRG